MKKAVNSEYGFMEGFVSALPAGLFEYSGTTLFDGRNCVKLFTEGGIRVAVKRFKKPNMFNRVAYTFFRGGKAERAYDHAAKLLEMGVNTPRPIGYVNVNAGGLLKSSYLVTEFTDYAPIAELVNGGAEGRRELMEAFVSFTVSLHMKGVRHDDYNLFNVLYKELPDGKYDFMLIDINRMRFGQMGKLDCVSNIKRICANPDFMYDFTKIYSRLRGWDIYKLLARTAISRSIFERRRSIRNEIKRRAFAKA